MAGVDSPAPRSWVKRSWSIAPASARRQSTFSSGLAAFVPSGSRSPAARLSKKYPVSPNLVDELTSMSSSSRNGSMVSPIDVIMMSKSPARTALERLSSSTATTYSIPSRYGSCSPVIPFGPRQ